MDEGLRMRIDALHESLDELDYYELLDVDPGSGHDDIRDAFYRLASDLHPDQHVGEEESIRAKVHAIFKRANEAYTVLASAARRKRYNEGLARGERRLSSERAPAPSRPRDPAATIQTPLGRQFYMLARQALAKGDLAAARLNLTIASNHEGPNDLLRETLTEVETRLREKKR